VVHAGDASRRNPIVCPLAEWGCLAGECPGREQDILSFSYCFLSRCLIPNGPFSLVVSPYHNRKMTTLCTQIRQLGPGVYCAKEAQCTWGMADARKKWHAQQKHSQKPQNSTQPNLLHPPKSSPTPRSINTTLPGPFQQMYIFLYLSKSWGLTGLCYVLAPCGVHSRLPNSSLYS
jgi:hypothetical protein